MPTSINFMQASPLSSHICCRLLQLGIHALIHYQSTKVADRYTIVEPISTEDTSETPLLPPSKLNIISFVDLDHTQLGVEFELVAVVANCTALQYTTNQAKRYLEAIIMDNKKRPFVFTIWDDLADHEGAELVRHLHEHHVIVATRVAVNSLLLNTAKVYHLLHTPYYILPSPISRHLYINTTS